MKALTKEPSAVDSEGRKVLRFTPDEWEALEKKLKALESIASLWPDPSMCAFVIFKVEGEQQHVDARVRDLLRQWESEHLWVGKEKTLILACHGEVSLESLEAQFSTAQSSRSATIHQIVHQEAPVPYAPTEKEK